MSKEYNKEFYDRWKPWALELCHKWNWTCNIPEIAKQINEVEKLKSTSWEFAVLRDVFNEFFGKGKPPIISQFEAITQCVEDLENNR